MIEAIVSAILVLTLIIMVAAIPNAIKSVKLYKRKDSFKCVLCGNCCRFRQTPLDESDIKRLKNEGYADSIIEGKNPRLKRVKGKCIFLNEDKCQIHEIRPTVCRQFPFFKIYGIGYCQMASFCPSIDDLKNG